MRSRFASFFLVCASSLLVLDIACSGGDTKPDVIDKRIDTVQISATPGFAAPDGTAVKLTAKAFAKTGQATGSVVISVPRGTLMGAPAASVTMPLGPDGSATVDYACNEATDPLCNGKQDVKATWNGVEGVGSVVFGRMVIKTDGGASSSGGSSGTSSSGGPKDAGMDGPSAPPANLKYENMKCGGVECFFLGAKGSTYNEAATVAFTVKDDKDQPVRNARVKLTLEDSPPDLVMSQASDFTDDQGRIRGLLTSGTGLGVFRVKAVAQDVADLSALSVPIGIRASTPSNQALSFSCAAQNLAVWAQNAPPSSIPMLTQCKFKLTDRLNNPVGRKLQVRFLTESGAVSGDANSKEWSPGGDNSQEGEGTITFNTNAKFPPRDVPPFPGEPSNGTKNPRDGVVTLIAFVRGAEFFTDSNSNGQYDLGEPFVDQGEPFVDENDDNVFQPGIENFVDDDNDGQYTPPNGKWDGGGLIWADTRITYSGVAIPQWVPGLPFSIPKKGATEVALISGDERFNVTSLNQSNWSVARVFGTKGNFSFTPDPKVEDFGFNLLRERVDVTVAEPHPPCGSALRCEWRTKLSNFASKNRLGVAKIIAPDTETESQTIRAKVTVNATTTELDLSGVVGAP
jgi:hypothetical protein